MPRVLVFFLLIISLLGCSSTKEEHPIDFYYWRSLYSISSFEKQKVAELKVGRLYTRFFDVDKIHGKIQPIGLIQNFKADDQLSLEYVPTVFITNRTFADTNRTQVAQLAKNVANFIRETAERGELRDYSEIQIDCDWTASTKDHYFYFLEELKKASKKKLSATLRLHQVKFRKKEGVPPLDKMVLMCYATENPTEGSTKNSILDVGIAKDYLQNIESYPVELDIALPIYSWAIITNHLGKVRLVNSFSEQNLLNQPVKKIGEGLYQAYDDFFIEKLYISKGFTVKVETVSPAVLDEMKQFLDQKLTHPYHLIYYHLDERFFKTLQ